RRRHTRFSRDWSSDVCSSDLGLPKSCMAFDIGLGCSGYVYGLSVIVGMMKATGLKKGLLMVGDVSTVTCSKEDKSAYPLFGDARSEERRVGKERTCGWPGRDS